MCLLTTDSKTIKTFSQKTGGKIFSFKKMGEFFLSSFRQGLAGVAFVSLAPIIPNGISNVRRILLGIFSINLIQKFKNQKWLSPGGRNVGFSWVGRFPSEQSPKGFFWGKHIQLHKGSNWGELKFADPSQARA